MSSLATIDFRMDLRGSPILGMHLGVRPLPSKPCLPRRGRTTPVVCDRRRPVSRDGATAREPGRTVPLANRPRIDEGQTARRPRSPQPPFTTSGTPATTSSTRSQAAATPLVEPSLLVAKGAPERRLGNESEPHLVGHEHDRAPSPAARAPPASRRSLPSTEAPRCMRFDNHSVRQSTSTPAPSAAAMGGPRCRRVPRRGPQPASRSSRWRRMRSAISSSCASAVATKVRPRASVRRQQGERAPALARNGHRRGRAWHRGS